MTRSSIITVKGQVVEVRDGEKRLSRSRWYGYRSLRIFAEDKEYYSVLVNTQKLNEYGFVPKVGQWVMVTGRLSENTNLYYDKSISWVSELIHIEPPSLERKLPTSSSDIKIMQLLDLITGEWMSLDTIYKTLNITKNLEKRFIRSNLRKLKKENVVETKEINGKICWKKKN